MTSHWYENKMACLKKECVQFEASAFKKVAEKNVTVSFNMYERTDGHTGKTVFEAEV